MEKGKFVISLDFELHWGVAELWDVKDRKDYFDNTRISIPTVLSLFEKYKIHATWATVGFLFAKNKAQLLQFSPILKPTYDKKKLSYYSLIDNGEVGEDEIDDPYHYASSLIEKIIKTPGQELATHTFAHYYCNESGQNEKQFEADIKAAQSIAKANFDVELQSLVFPRNQFNATCTEIARQNGIKVVRSNPDVWFWKSKSRFMALARAADTFLSIGKTLTFTIEKKISQGVLLLPASRFLRPFTEREKVLQPLKIKRIKKEMEFAAKNNEIYHLWWHPHNFGYSLTENLYYLEEILKHYAYLNQEYGFQSKSMIEMYDN